MQNATTPCKFLSHLGAAGQDSIHAYKYCFSLFLFFLNPHPSMCLLILVREEGGGGGRGGERERERERRERNIYVRQLNHLAKAIVLFFIKNTITLKELLLFSKKNLQQYINNMFIYQETCIHLKHILNGN